MIYLIGGVPRVGKTTIARNILEKDHISSISTDAIRNLLDFSPTKLGILDLDWEKRPEAFFPYFLQFLKILQTKYENYVVEGDIFTPMQIKSIKDKIELKCCFLGASQITLENIKTVQGGNDWVSKMPEDKQSGLPAWTIKKSLELKKECERLEFAYFDIHPDREKALDDCYRFLMK